MDLAASNTFMWKTNAELVKENKGLSTKVVELKSKIKELNDNHAELMKQIAKLIGKVDAGKDELAKEMAENATLKTELESTLKKMQFIAVNVILHAMAELMGEFKRGEHDNWDPD